MVFGSCRFVVAFVFGKHILDWRFLFKDNRDRAITVRFVVSCSNRQRVNCATVYPLALTC